jgi:hypothetical protein
MKVIGISIIIKACLALFILTSCESHEQKLNDAFDRFKEEKMMSTDDKGVIKETAIKTDKLEPVKIKENTDEWVNFKIHIEKIILTNENKAKKIKQSPETNVKLLKRISRLEKDNVDLKRQLKEYEEEVKLNLEKFKKKINDEVNDMDSKLKDISVSEKQ